MHDRRTDAKAQFEVLVACELARRDERVDMPQHPLQQARRAPQLRRPPRLQYALEAALLVAGLAVESPEHVRRTYEPVLVRGIELERVTVRQRRDSH